MTVSQSDKAVRFRGLHEAPGAFVIPNPWDAGSARILAALGFQALATSSGAEAGTLGRRDGKVTRDGGARARPSHRGCHRSAGEPRISRSASRTRPPRRPRRSVSPPRWGLVGGSIEDATGNKDKPLFDIGVATERVAAAAAAARALPFPFTLTARTESFLRGNPNLDDVIRRLQAFEKAGADVLMAPGLPDLAAVHAVCAAVKKPVNFMVGIKGKSFTAAELTAAGVKRISLATSLYRTAMSGLIDAAREVKGAGTFGYVDRGVSSADLAGFMEG